ncbi:O-methyltransferase [Brevibacillus marinus]|uniref:O-methyltransferase n=1 Tax=Brevibacillus marinus TaxID=2496837 RepID=UPI000F82AB92|nr:O-methyltransferase [Brevibacillus marinus]
MITRPEVEAYLASLLPARSDLLARLEREAADERIPIIQPASAQLIRLWLLAQQPVRILEIGTAIGYSTIWLAEAAPQARITTIEIDANRASRARANLAAAGAAERVEVIVGDAVADVPNVAGPFDCLFIDAAKGQYRTFLDRYLPLVRVGGSVICDNVLFRGWVSAPEQADQRRRPLVEKIARYNRYLAEHPQLETSFIPIGDGLAISIKTRS